MDMKLRVLKAKIRGLEAEGRSIRAQINRSSGSRKDQLWLLKRELGYYTRHHLIAYGLLRGVPYESIEPRTATVYMNFVLVHEIITDSVQLWHKKDWTVERVYKLLARQKQPEHEEPEAETVPSNSPQVMIEKRESKNICTRALEFLRGLS